MNGSSSNLFGNNNAIDNDGMNISPVNPLKVATGNFNDLLIYLFLDVPTNNFSLGGNSLFGATPSTAGATNSNGFLFGNNSSNNNATNLFGGDKAQNLFGNNSNLNANTNPNNTSGGLFGNFNNNGSSLFGNVRFLFYFLFSLINIYFNLNF